MSGVTVSPIGASARYTGGILGDRILSDEVGSHTAFVHTDIDNYFLRIVLPAWNETLSRSVIDPVLCNVQALARSTSGSTEKVLHVSSEYLTDRSATVLTSGTENVYTQSAYDAVRFIQEALGVSLNDVTKSAKISRRTYYNWRKSNVLRPRLASEGRLWKLVQITEDLLDLLGRDLHKWIRADSKRRSMLLKGEFDELLSALMLERSRTEGHARFTSIGPSSAVGEESDLGQPSIERRVASRRTVARRTDRRTISASDE
jgi:hypothetical protein